MPEPQTPNPESPARLRRAESWPEFLAAFIEARKCRAFEWGAHDCALFACDAVLEMTGVDLAEDFRGQYSDAVSALRVIRRTALGVGELAENLAANFGIAEVPPALARRGDIVLFDGEHGETLGIVALDGCHVLAPAEDGLDTRPLAIATRAWRI
jgi:hypothetical protein